VGERDSVIEHPLTMCVGARENPWYISSGMEAFFALDRFSCGWQPCGNYESFTCKSSFLRSSSRAIKKIVRLGRSLYNTLFRGIGHVNYCLRASPPFYPGRYDKSASATRPSVRRERQIKKLCFFVCGKSPNFSKITVIRVVLVHT